MAPPSPPQPATKSKSSPHPRVLIEDTGQTKYPDQRDNAFNSRGLTLADINPRTDSCSNRQRTSCTATCFTMGSPSDSGSASCHTRSHPFGLAPQTTSLSTAVVRMHPPTQPCRDRIIPFLLKFTSRCLSLLVRTCFTVLIGRYENGCIVSWETLS